jgi:hypothetical protein
VYQEVRMPVNLDILLQSPIFDFWAVPATFIPATGAPFAGRGIYNTWEIDVPSEDGTIYSDQRTVFDIRKSEFVVLPKQDDRIDIPFDCSNLPLGLFQIIDVDDNGGGQLYLTIRKIQTAG